MSDNIKKTDVDVMVCNASPAYDFDDVNPPEGATTKLVTTSVMAAVDAFCAIVTIAQPELVPITLSIAVIAYLATGITNAIDDALEMRNEAEKDAADAKEKRERAEKLEAEIEKAKLLMDRITKKIENVSADIKNQIDEIKEIMVEMKFDDETVVPVFVLMKMLSDCLTNHNSTTIKNFKRAYEKHNALDLTYTVIGLLDQDATNPVKLAMKTIPLANYKTFKKWENMISVMLGQLILIESFAYGWELGTKYSLQRLCQASKEATNSLREFGNTYTGKEFIDQLKTYLPVFLEENKHLNNKEKCQKLEKILDDVQSEESIYVVFFNQGETEGMYDTYVYNDRNKGWVNPKRLVEIYNHAGGCAMVYRCRNDYFTKGYEQTARTIENRAQNRFKGGPNLSGQAKELYGHLEKYFDRKQFLSLIDKKCDPQAFRHYFRTNAAIEHAPVVMVNADWDGKVLMLLGDA
ncbi:unnamed protein product [Caenorhabditis nigoni]